MKTPFGTPSLVKMGMLLTEIRRDPPAGPIVLDRLGERILKFWRQHRPDLVTKLTRDDASGEDLKAAVWHCTETTYQAAAHTEGVDNIPGRQALELARRFYAFIRPGEGPPRLLFDPLRVPAGFMKAILEARGKKAHVLKTGNRWEPR